MASKFTLARQSVWDAIDHWTDLDRKFRQKIRYEANSPSKLTPFQMEEPSGVDFPAIGIFPSAINPTWLGNQIQFRPVSLTITIWTEGWNTLDQNEQLCEDTLAAIYNCKPEGSGDTYVGAATAHGPYGFGNSRWTRVRFSNGQKAISNSFDVVLKIITSMVQ